MAANEIDANTIEAKSWEDLNQILFGLSKPTFYGRLRSNFVFRGTTKVYDLETSLYRLGGPFEKLERPLLRNFRKYGDRDAVSFGSVWHWLSLAQHHGLPTRLLDWTFSPFVAMHFVTDRLDHYHEDGLIWCVDFTAAHALLPKTLQDMQVEEYTYVFTVEMLSKKFDSLADFDAMGGDFGNLVVFFEPPSLDPRVVNQFALFSLMSDPKSLLHKWLEHRPQLYKRVIVPARIKWEVRDRLDQANITERMLFPGLDGLSRWLSRHYSPKDSGRAPSPPRAEDARVPDPGG